LKTTFIRGLWGDRRVKAYANCLTDVPRRDHPPGTLTYCYGSENLEYLRGCGIEPIVMDTVPIRDYLGAGERAPDDLGEFNYGLSLWYHKEEVIRTALDSYDEVVFLDWDTVQVVKPLPDDFWDRLRFGQPFQASLVHTRHSYCPWRARGGNYRPHASFVYCRDKQIIRDMMQLHLAHPMYTEETIFGLWGDLQLGPIGEDAEAYFRLWKTLGYEPYCHSCRMQATRPDVEIFHHRKN
jgi:hypothetical protein